MYGIFYTFQAIVKSTHFMDKSTMLQLEILDYIHKLYLSIEYDSDNFGGLCKLQRFIIGSLLDKSFINVDLLKLFWEKQQYLLDIIIKIPQVNH